jgi:acetyl esterase
MLEANRRSGRPLLSAGTAGDARALFSSTRGALGSGPSIVSAEDIRLPTRRGSIPARLFRPAQAMRGLIVYLHGGGWVVGALDDFDALARTLAARSGCALMLVDYRLAPEHSFPAGLDDVEDSIRWAAATREHLVGHAAPLIVAGDSAGANLATVAANALRGEIDISLQLLIYPVTDCAMNTASYQQHGTGLTLTTGDMRWFFGQYAPESLWSDPRIAPLRAADLSGAAPAWIATAQYDILRDEGEAYAMRLAAAGVPVELHNYAGMTHGFVRMMNVLDVADRFVTDAADAIARHCTLHEALAPRPGAP